MRLAVPLRGRQFRGLMLDIRIIREQAETVRARLRQRGGDVWKLVDEVLSLDDSRRKGETEKQALQSQRNSVSKDIGIAKKQGQDTTPIEAEMRGFGDRIDALNKETGEKSKVTLTQILETSILAVSKAKGVAQ